MDASGAAIVRFAKELRRLHIHVGRPSLREIEEGSRRCGKRRLTRSTVDDKLNGRTKVDMEFLSAFHAVLVAHGDAHGYPLTPDDRDIRSWRRLWREMNQELVDAKAAKRRSIRARADLFEHPGLIALSQRSAAAVVAQLEIFSTTRSGEWSAAELLEQAAAHRSLRSTMALVAALRKAGRDEDLGEYVRCLATPRTSWPNRRFSLWTCEEALRARGWDSEADDLLMEALSEVTLGQAAQILKAIRLRSVKELWSRAVVSVAHREAAEKAVLIGYLLGSGQRDVADDVLTAAAWAPSISVTVDLLAALVELELLPETVRLADTFVDERTDAPGDIADLMASLSERRMPDQLLQVEPPRGALVRRRWPWWWTLYAGSGGMTTDLLLGSISSQGSWKGGRAVSHPRVPAYGCLQARRWCWRDRRPTDVGPCGRR